MILIMQPAIFSLFDNGVTTLCTKDDVLFRCGETVQSMYIVVEGRVDLVRYTANGAGLILFRARAGQVLAEASLYSTTYHCDGRSVGLSKLRSIPVAEFRGKLSSDTSIARTWAEGLAHALQAARMSAEIRTLRTVSERLDAWLAVNGSLPAKGEWQDLAQILGVSREALYRELSARRG